LQIEYDMIGTMNRNFLFAGNCDPNK